jgi:hypothetical protein
MAKKSINQVVKDLGSKYEKVNQRPACCGSKASWENVFGPGGEPVPPPCCGDFGIDSPYFGVNTAPVGNSSMISDSWFSRGTECSVYLKFVATATNLLNDPVAVIHVSIGGIIYDLTWGIPNSLLVNPGDEVFFIFDHTKDICNEAYMNVVNMTCPINYFNVMALYFGDPPCRG